jgi:hypothetical protein
MQMMKMADADTEVRRVLQEDILNPEALRGVVQNVWCPRGDSNTRHAV